MMPSFSEKVANTGMYVLLCKARVLLFPEFYINIKGQSFLERHNTRPQGVILKDDTLVGIVKLLAEKYKTEFRDLENKYFGDTKLFDYFENKDYDPALRGKAIMEKELLLPTLTREKFFRKQASMLIKNHGVKQILILGSGLDTFAIRKRKYTEQFGVKFFEFDRPEPLNLKQELLEELYGLTNATYVRGSYLEPAWFANLKDAGLDVSQSTLVVWGGNVMYLTRVQMGNVMNQLSSAFNVEADLFITFDYFHPSAVSMEDAIVADKAHHGRLLQDMLEGFKSTFNIEFSSEFSPSELPGHCSKFNFSIWQDQHLTAGEHVKSTLKIEEDPVYTEEYYSYATLINKYS